MNEEKLSQFSESKLNRMNRAGYVDGFPNGLVLLSLSNTEDEVKRCG